MFRHSLGLGRSLVCVALFATVGYLRPDRALRHLDKLASGTATFAVPDLLRSVFTKRHFSLTTSKLGKPAARGAESLDAGQHGGGLFNVGALPGGWHQPKLRPRNKANELLPVRRRHDPVAFAPEHEGGQRQAR